jgi:copper chaperone NosL
MRRTLAVLIVLTMAAAGLAACGVRADGPPEIQVDRTPCSRCGMLVSEPLYAAAFQAPGSAPRVFDDIGCLRKAARAERGDVRIWVHDAADSTWLDGANAVFVASSAIHSPMGGGLLAYRDLAAAERAAAKYHGRVIRSLPELLQMEVGS